MATRTTYHRWLLMLIAVLLVGARSAPADEDKTKSDDAASGDAWEFRVSEWQLLITFDPELLNLDAPVLASLFPLNLPSTSHPPTGVFEAVNRRFHELWESVPDRPKTVGQYNKPLADEGNLTLESRQTVTLHDGAVLWSLKAGYWAPADADWTEPLGKTLRQVVKQRLERVQQITVGDRRARIEHELQRVQQELANASTEYDESLQRVSKFRSTVDAQQLTQQLLTHVNSRLADSSIQRAELEAARMAIQRELQGQAHTGDAESSTRDSSDKPNTAPPEAPEDDGQKIESAQASKGAPQAKVDELEHLVHILQQSAEAARLAFQRGGVSQAEVAKADADVIQARIQLIQARQEVLQASAQRTAARRNLVDRMAEVQQQMAQDEGLVALLRNRAKRLRQDMETHDKQQLQLDRAELQCTSAKQRIGGLQERVAELQMQLQRLEGRPIHVHLLGDGAQK